MGDTMHKLITTILFGLFLLATPTLASEQCTIFTYHGILPDSDCDGVHDMVDNCPLSPNANQHDSNRDGIGDSCDLIIEEVTVNPNVIVRANDFFSVDVMVLNNQGMPLQGLQIELDNNDLNFHVTTDVPYLAAGTAHTTEFLLKVPRCTPEKHYPIRITTRYYAEGREHVEQTTETLRVVNGGVCEGPRTVMENTIVETFFEQEIDVGSKTIIPVRIVNLNEDSVTYNVRMDGLDTWATYRLEPSTTFTLPSGHDTTRYLAIELEEWAPLGMNHLNVVVEAQGEAERFPINLFIRKAITANQNEQLKQALEVTLILLLFALIIAGFVIAYKKINEEHATHEELMREQGIDMVEEKK